MTHSFLLESGRWTMQGSWLEKDSMPISFKGITLIVWDRDDWFSMVTKFMFPDSDRSEIICKYKCRLNDEGRQYTFLLEHTVLGQVEGEGWICPDTIVQRYWVVSDRQRRSGFDTLHQISQDNYYLTSGILEGHFLTSTMEASIERHE